MMYSVYGVLLSSFMSDADIVKRYQFTSPAVENYLYRKYGGYGDKLFELYMPCDVILLARHGSIHPSPPDTIFQIEKGSDE